MVAYSTIDHIQTNIYNLRVFIYKNIISDENMRYRLIKKLIKDGMLNVIYNKNYRSLMCTFKNKPNDYYFNWNSFIINIIQEIIKEYCNEKVIEEINYNNINLDYITSAIDIVDFQNKNGFMILF